VLGLVNTGLDDRLQTGKLSHNSARHLG